MNDEETSLSSDVCNFVNCNWNRKLLANYLAIMFPYMITSLISMVLIRLWTGRVIFSIIYGSFLVVFFIFIRTKVLCSHCPYYKDKKFLDPLPKIWKYNKRPINQVGISITSIGMLFFLTFPVISLSIGARSILEKSASIKIWQLAIYFIFIFLAILFAIFYIIKLTNNFCTKCINIVCPMNRVPKEVITKYLEFNTELKNVYHESGYTFD